MNITQKIILADTNIITDLNVANVLDKFIKLDNVFISDMIRNDEINFKTCDIDLIRNMKTVSSSPNQIMEMCLLSMQVSKLTRYDVMNYIIARDNNYLLATGDKALKEFSEKNQVTVIRTLKIIEFMYDNNIITLDEVINGLNSLKNYPKTRIPIQLIDELLDKIKNSATVC